MHSYPQHDRTAVPSVALYIPGATRFQHVQDTVIMLVAFDHYRLVIIVLCFLASHLLVHVCPVPQHFTLVHIFGDL
jgi:hypothetical protein